MLPSLNTLYSHSRYLYWRMMYIQYVICTFPHVVNWYPSNGTICHDYTVKICHSKCTVYCRMLLCVHQMLLYLLQNMYRIHIYIYIYCTLYNTNPMQIKIINGLGFTVCEWTFSIGTPYQCYASVSSMWKITSKVSKQTLTFKYFYFYFYCVRTC